MVSIHAFSCTFLMIFAVALGLLAQNPTATLLGTVRDASGAVVVDATIELRSQDTGATRKATVSEKGEFTVPNLPPGPYEATITKAGFRTVHETNIVLQMDQVARMDVQLELGTISQSIEVSDTVPLITTENGTKGEVMTSAQMLEMPLNGRDFTDLAFIVPGVTYAPDMQQGGSIVINGTRSDNTNYLIDGFGARDTLFGGAVTSPNIDAMQEFKMQTNNFSAEYGRLAGGVLNMVLKSGTNQFHGALFEFLRNDAVDARNFFDQNKSELRRNQFGGLLSGPVQIPRLYNGRDRTFFLFSWESYRQVQGSPALGVVPTQAQKTGDFSATGAISDPLSTGNCAGSTGKGGCFPGNSIPLSRLSRQALAAQEFYPAPNLNGLNNMSSYAVSPSNWDSFILKFDERISSNDTVSFRITRKPSNGYSPFANPQTINSNNTGLFGSYALSNATLAGLIYTHLFSARLINELRLGFTRTTVTDVGALQGTDYNGLFGMSGGPTDPKMIGFPLLAPSGYQQLGPGNAYPLVYLVNSLPMGDTLTWVKSGHFVKVGIDVLHTQTVGAYANNSRGTYLFTGYWTGRPYADFLLGYANSTSRLVTTNVNHLLATSYGSFVQDDWKVRDHLTVNLGLRWEINRPMVDSAGRLANFDPATGQIVIASTKTIEGSGIGFANPGQMTTASQIGLPPSLVFTNHKAFAPRFGFAWRPFGGNRTVLRGGYGIFYAGNIQNGMRGYMANIFPFVISQSITRNATNPLYLTLANPFPAAPNLTSSSVTVGVYEIHPPAQYMQSWNLTIEREIGFSSALKISYVGSKGTHLGMQNDLNQPYDRSAALPGGIVPYPGFGTLNYFSLEGNSIYNGATATWQRRFSGGFFYTANYTYSKSIDEASQFNAHSNGGIQGLQNVRCLRCDRGRSDWDRGHMFTTAFSWECPYRNALIHGWQLAGTSRIYSGTPFTAVVTNASLALGEASRPNRIGKGTIPDPGPGMWYKVADFPVVPNGSFAFGNAGRSAVDGPGRIEVNLSVSKNFVLRESHRVQFRWEVFNVLNHANFGLPENAVNAPNAGTLLSADAGRLMQFALRYSF